MENNYNFPLESYKMVIMDYGDKYFIPKIEDIRVGYECEFYTGPHWTKMFIVDRNVQTSEQLDIRFTIDSLKDNEIRVPYLTKEQIEAEGWKTVVKSTLKQEETARGKHFLKGGFYATLTETYSLEILYVAAVYPYQRFYYGDCKDINTFRYICKLLNI